METNSQTPINKQTNQPTNKQTDSSYSVSIVVVLGVEDVIKWLLTVNPTPRYGQELILPSHVHHLISSIQGAVVGVTTRVHHWSRVYLHWGVGGRVARVAGCHGNKMQSNQ